MHPGILTGVNVIKTITVRELKRTISCSLTCAALLAATGCAPTPPVPEQTAAPVLASGPSLAQSTAPAPAATLPPELPGRRPDGSVLLPNHWSLRPAGNQVELGDFPINVAVHPDGRFAAVLHTGYGAHQIMVVDIAAAQVVSRTAVHEAFYGLEFSKDGHQLFCSGAGDEVVHAFAFEQGQLTNHTRIKLRDARLRAVPAGLAVSANTQRLFVANVWATALPALTCCPSRRSLTLCWAPTPPRCRRCQSHRQLTLTPMPRPSAMRPCFIKWDRMACSRTPVGWMKSSSGSTSACGHKRRWRSLT